MVAEDDVERLAVRPEPQCMRSVLAAALNRLQLGHLVELASALGITQAVQTAARPAVDRDVQAAEGVEQPLRGGNLDVEAFDLCRLVAADGRRRDPAQAFALLVAGDEP